MILISAKNGTGVSELLDSLCDNFFAQTEELLFSERYLQHVQEC